MRDSVFKPKPLRGAAPWQRPDAGPHERVAGMAATAGEIFFAPWLIFGGAGIGRLLHGYRDGASPDAS
jgi:hypothetical protein